MELRTKLSYILQTTVLPYELGNGAYYSVFGFTKSHNLFVLPTSN